MLDGLTSEYDVTEEIIRGMDKSLADGIDLLINKEATIQISERTSNQRTALSIVDGDPKRIKCH